MPDQAADLLKLRQHIDQSKAELARLGGQRDQLMATLKQDFNCATLEEADEFLKELEAEAEKLQRELDTGVAALKGGLGW